MSRERSSTSAPNTVRCDFVGFGPEAALTVVSAIVDQMCGHADVDALLLASLEVPLVEVFDVIAQQHATCESVAVTIFVTNDGPVLAVELIVPTFSTDDPEELFGGALPLIASFFDQTVEIRQGVLDLRGLLS